MCLRSCHSTFSGPWPKAWVLCGRIFAKPSISPRKVHSPKVRCIRCVWFGIQRFISRLAPQIPLAL